MRLLRAGLKRCVGTGKFLCWLCACSRSRSVLWIVYLQWPQCSPSGWCPSLCHMRQCIAALRQDNQEMKAKAVMRWTCQSCGESKDVRFDNMKRFGPGKHKCSKQSQPQEKEANAKGKDGRPSVTTLHCNQLAAEYGCDWLGVLVDNAVHVDDSLISSICVMRWQCWGCTTNFDRTYNNMKIRGFVCSTCNTS